MLVAAFEGHRRFGEKTTQQLDLFLAAHAAVAEVLAERFVLDRVPPDADPEAEPTFGEKVDFGGLFGDERGLALREDDDPGHDLERRDRGDVSEQYERLVERRADVIGAAPTFVHRGIGPEHVVVREQVRVPEPVDTLRVRPHRADVASQFGLREHHADTHTAVSTTGPARSRPRSVRCRRSGNNIHQNGRLVEADGTTLVSSWLLLLTVILCWLVCALGWAYWYGGRRPVAHVALTDRPRSPFEVEAQTSRFRAAGVRGRAPRRTRRRCVGIRPCWRGCRDRAEAVCTPTSRCRCCTRSTGLVRHRAC